MTMTTGASMHAMLSRRAVHAMLSRRAMHAMLSRRAMRALALVVLVLGSSLATQAGAQRREAPASRASESAERVIQQGVAARRAGDDEQALRLFTEAYGIAPSGRARAQMALAEQALGLYVESESHLTEALATSDPWVARNRATLEQSLAEIATHLASIEVRVTVPGGAEAPADARIVVNGREVGTAPLARPLRVIAGTVQIEVHAEGFTTAARTLIAAAGEQRREVLQLVRAAALAVSSDATTAGSDASGADRGSSDVASGTGELERTLGTALLAAGGASWIVTGIGIGLREDRAQSYNALTCPPMASDPRCGALRSEGSLWETTAIVSGIAGGALLATGTVLHLVAPSGRDARESAEASCAPSALGMVCSGRF
jgi:hypothetical protein